MMYRTYDVPPINTETIPLSTVLQLSVQEHLVQQSANRLPQLKHETGPSSHHWSHLHTEKNKNK